MRAKRFIGLIMTGMIAVAGLLYGNVAEAAMNPAPAGQSSYTFNFITPGTTDTAASVTITKTPSAWGKTVTLKATVDVKDASQFKSNMYIWNGVASNSNTYTVSANEVVTFGLNGVKMTTNNQAAVISGTDGQIGYEYHQHVDGTGTIVPEQIDNDIPISSTPGGCFGTTKATRREVVGKKTQYCGCQANYDWGGGYTDGGGPKCRICGHTVHSNAGWVADTDGDGVIDWTSGGCPWSTKVDNWKDVEKDFYDINTLTCSLSNGTVAGEYVVMVIKNIDATAPTVTWGTSPKADTWTNGNVTVTVTGTDTQPDGTAGCGLDDLAYSYDGGNTWTNQNTFVMEGNGSHDVLVRDGLGNQSKATFSVGNIDKTAPSASWSISPNASVWTPGNVTVTITASDGQSGLADAAYSYDGGRTWTNQNTYVMENNGKLDVVVRDKVGNTTRLSPEVHNMDKVPPAVVWSISPTADVWTTSDVTVTITAVDNADGSGLADLAYSYDGGNTWTNQNTYVMKENGTLDVVVRDKVGNTTRVAPEVHNIDRTPPTVTWDTDPKADVWTREDVTVTVTAVDVQPDVVKSPGCGLDVEAYSYDGGLTWTSDNTYVMTDNGTHDVLVRDELGNQTKITAEVHNIDRIPPTAIIRTVETGKNGTVRIEVIAADGESGLEAKPYKFDVDEYTATTSKDVSTSGKHTVIVRDAVGNAVECNDWLYMLHLDMNGGSYNGSKDEVIVTVPVYDDYDKFRVNTNGTKAGAVTGNITQRIGYVDDATGAFIAIGERTIPHEVAGEQLGVIDAYGAFNIDGVNGVYTRMNGDELQRFLGWSWDKDTKKPLNKYNVFNSARNGQFNIEEWSSDCATIVSEDAWNGHAGANLNPSGLGFGTHDYSYTIYGVWEPVLQVNMDLTRSLGDLSYSNPAVAQATRVTNVKASQRIAHVAGEALANNFDHTSCEEVHSVVLRTIIRPGEQGSYRVVTSGSIPETVTTIEFSHNITDIYNNGDSTSTWYDNLNPAVSDADGKYMVSGTIHPEHQNDDYVGIGVANDDPTSGIVKHGLNRLYSGKTRNIFNKFYTPKYFGTDKSYDTSKNVGATSGESGSTKYYIWATVSQPSIYYKWVYSSEENLCICGQIDVVTYSPDGGDSGGDKEIPPIPGGHAQNSEPTTLDELRSRLRIRIIGE